MVWEDNIDLGEGIIPIHLLNLVCAVHLRQEHGFKRWQISKFEATYPWLIREDGTFAFAALHYLVHVLVHAEEAAVPLDQSGTVAFVRLIKPPGVTDHLHPQWPVAAAGHASSGAWTADVFDFQLTDEEMTGIAAMDSDASVFFDHRDHEIVSRIGNVRAN